MDYLLKIESFIQHRIDNAPLTARTVEELEVALYFISELKKHHADGLEEEFGTKK